MSFFNSEIMRSYYKTAQKKGWVQKQLPIVKKAAVESNLNPSDNLLVDVCKLANVLRIKGYIKQAQDIENKIAAFKSAETHLYKVHNEGGTDLLEFAHPDGDAFIESAKDKLGDVETLLSQHKKTVDIVNKIPTGKLGYIATHILKNAQESGFQTNINALISSLHDEDLGSDGSPLLEYQPYKLLKIFEPNSGFESFAKYFESRAPQIARSIKSYVARSRQLYGEAPQNEVTISQNIMRIPSVQGLIDYGRIVSPAGKYDIYFTGSQPSIKKSLNIGMSEDNPMVVDNQNSIWAVSMSGGLFKDQSQVQKLAKMMQQDMEKHNEMAFTGISSVNSAIRAELNDAKMRMQKLISSPPKTEGELKSALSQFMNNGDVYNRIVPLLEGMLGSAADYESIINILKDSVTSATKERSGQAQVTATRFSKASEIYDKLSDVLDLEGLEENARKSLQIASVLNDYDGNFQNLLDALQPLLPGMNFKDFSELDRFSQQWLTVANNNNRELGPAESKPVYLEDLPEEE